jgi:DNA polymerase-3 subunit delta'
MHNKLQEKHIHQESWGWREPVGLEAWQERLLRASKAGRLAHTLLIQGPEGSGKEALALWLARLLLCSEADTGPCNRCGSCQRMLNLNHPDFLFLHPLPPLPAGQKEKDPREVFSDEIRLQMIRIAENHYHPVEISGARGILIDQIRSLRRWSALQSFEEGRRIALISQADLMNPNAQNALLKLAEEPPEDFFLLLTTTLPASLLPTIISRCQVISLTPVPKAEIQHALQKLGLSEETAGLTAQQARGNLHRALELAMVKDERPLAEVVEFLRATLSGDPAPLAALTSARQRERDREELRKLLEGLVAWFRDVNLLQQGEDVQELLEHPEELETLKRFAAAYHLDDPVQLLNSLEKLIDLLKANLYYASLLHEVIFTVRRHVRRR